MTAIRRIYPFSRGNSDGDKSMKELVSGVARQGCRYVRMRPAHLALIALDWLHSVIQGSRTLLSILRTVRYLGEGLRSLASRAAAWRLTLGLPNMVICPCTVTIPA